MTLTLTQTLILNYDLSIRTVKNSRCPERRQEKKLRQSNATRCPQMLRKSVETRDWLNTIEPRNVRAVMKHVVADITCIDGEVGRLYEEGVRRDRSSDSTKRSFNASRPATRSNWSFTPRSAQGRLRSSSDMASFKCFFWKFHPHPHPRNTNNVEPYIVVMLFSGKSDTLPLPVTLELQHCCIVSFTVLVYFKSHSI